MIFREDRRRLTTPTTYVGDSVLLSGGLEYIRPYFLRFYDGGVFDLIQEHQGTQLQMSDLNLGGESTFC